MSVKDPLGDSDSLEGPFTDEVCALSAAPSGESSFIAEMVRLRRHVFPFFREHVPCATRCGRERCCVADGVMFADPFVKPAVAWPKPV